MKKLIIKLLSIALILSVFIEPLSVFSAVVDYDKKCRLTLTYSKNDVVFSDLEIKIYRVADCDFNKIKPFENYPVNISNIKSQAEWNDIASTLSAYTQSDNLTPYKTAQTDADGKVIFEDIDVGLYLIAGIVTEKESRIYTFFDSMIYLPAPSLDEYLYDVSAKPKSEEIIVFEKDCSILKLWKDEGSTSRPKSVTVDILKNGKAFDTVVLDSSNNWQHTFKITDAKSKWSVVEKNIPEGYTVTVSEKETSFIIVNTKKSPHDPTDAPQTGDSSPIELYVLIFCISGLLLIVLGFGIRRRENAAKK